MALLNNENPAQTKNDWLILLVEFGLYSNISIFIYFLVVANNLYFKQFKFTYRLTRIWNII